MKVLGNLPVVKDSNSKYPFGANIKDETSSEQGTPIYRGIMGDILMNLYKVLEKGGITPNGNEDDNTTSYQLVEALQKLPNLLNDVEQVLTKSGLVWYVGFNLSLLPNKYVFFARASEDYLIGNSYTFKGLEVATYPFSSPTGFKANDELLVIIDTATVRAYSLSVLTQDKNEYFASLGTPIDFNDTNEMWYLNDGYLMNDTPFSDNLQNRLRVFSGIGDLELLQVFLKDNTFSCVCFNPSSSDYISYDVSKLNLSVILESGVFINDSDYDFNPIFIMDNLGSLYATNRGNQNDGLEDYKISKFTRNISNYFTLNSSIIIDNTFVKNTNSLIKDGYLYTFVNGNLDRFNLTTGVKQNVMYLPNMNGQVFIFNSLPYFMSGEVAKKWNL